MQAHVLRVDPEHAMGILGEVLEDLCVIYAVFVDGEKQFLHMVCHEHHELVPFASFRHLDSFCYDKLYILAVMTVTYVAAWIRHLVGL